MSTMLDNIDSVPDDVRIFVMRTILINELVKLYAATDTFNSQAFSFGYDISQFHTQMRAALGKASDVICEHQEQEAA